MEGKREGLGEEEMGVSGLDPNTLYAQLLNKVCNKNKAATRK